MNAALVLLALPSLHAPPLPGPRPATPQEEAPFLSLSPPFAIDLEELPWRIAEQLEGLAEQDLFAGAVLVAKDGEVLFGEAYGPADREHDVPITLDTPMGLASMNKMFTGLLVAQLVAEGKLAYDATVGTYLPDWPNPVVRERVTLHQLLTHTSGLGSYWTDEYRERKDELTTLQEYASLFATKELLFEPGARMEYSNDGPVVLGLLIEAVTGKSYFDVARERIYAPAGMTHTDHYLLTRQAEAGFARAYVRSSPDAPWTSDEPMQGLRGTPAGGGYSSAEDLLRFSRALLAGKLLPRERLEALWTPHVPLRDMGPLEFGYGYLWGIEVVNGVRWVGHNGGGGGVSTEFDLDPEHGYVIVVLGNLAGCATPVSEWIQRTISLSLAG